MEPVTTAAAITAGISALSGGAQAVATGKQNKKSRQFSRENYAKTKADNIQFWNMQNEYNSPEKQMERLKAAGLNPNIVYDKGGAVQPAGNIATPDVQGAQFRTPDFTQISNPIQGYFDTKIKQAQYDNLKAANTTMQQEALLKAAETLRITAATKGQSIANLLAETNFQYSVEGARLANEATRANTQFTLDSNTRAQIMQGKSMELIAQDILLRKEQTANSAAERANIRQQLNNLKKDELLKDFDINLRKMGINPTDPTWMRIATQALQPYIEQVTDGSLFEYGKKKFGEFGKWNQSWRTIGGVKIW
jgi:hypothetical protein